MTPRFRAVCHVAIFLVLGSANIGAATADPDKDPAFTKLVEDAQTLVKKKQLKEGIAICDKVIAAFKSHYANSESRIYCARSSAETLGYLTKAAAEMNKGEFDKGKKNAIALSSKWSAAYFVKAYALQELGRIAEAKAALKLALELSPWNSHYLSELGSVYKLEKNWKEAKAAFEAAEEHAGLSPDDRKAFELGLARRGLGYVLVELGQLDEAEAKYLQCLKDDPKDSKAAAELDYVRGLKAKR